MLVKNDRLILLLELEGKHTISESTDLVHWINRAIGPEFEQPLSVECDGKYYCLGLSDGKVLNSTNSAN